MTSKYINIFTDFGFKKIFGEEASKPLLMDFLQCLLPQAHIANISFKDKEKLGKSVEDRKAIFDIYCENASGEKIIVEMQKAKQNYFKDRSVFYATFPIQEQSEKGDWNYELKAVYCVGILDFKFEDNLKLGKKEVMHSVNLKDQNNQVFYDKLTFVYLEMPHFDKKENELETQLDKWLYFMKYLESFESIPIIFKNTVFVEAFTKAEIAKYTDAERANYQESLKTYRDLKNSIDTSFDEGKIEGKIEGIKEGKIEVAKNFKNLGVAIEVIMQATGLSKNEIEEL